MVASIRRSAAGSIVVLLLLGMLGVVPAGAEVQNNPVFPSVDCGGEWHWVHNQLPDGVTSGTLTVVFEGMGPIEVVGEPNSAVMHYYLILGGGATLVSAEDDIDGGLLVLSHWPECTDESTTTTASTSSTSSTSTTSSSTSSTSSSSTTSSSTSTTPTTTTSLPTTTTTSGLTTTTGQMQTTSTSSASGSSTTTTTVLPSEDPASITVSKRTIPSGAPGSFVIVITADDGSRRWTVVLEDGETATIPAIEAGVYSVVEQLPTDTVTIQWDLESISCSDGSPASAVDVSAGEDVACEVTNRVTEAAETTVTTVPPVTATTLPFTGADIARITAVGAALTAFGALVLSAVTSRRQTQA